MNLTASRQKTGAPSLRPGSGRSERGALVEYALLLTLIAVFCIVALSAPGLHQR